jgi:hypothetical protein
MPAGGLNGFGVAGIGVAHDRQAWIGREHSLESEGRLRGTVRHDDLPGVLGKADPDPTPVVE